MNVLTFVRPSNCNRICHDMKMIIKHLIYADRTIFEYSNSQKVVNSNLACFGRTEMFDILLIPNILLIQGPKSQQ